MATFIPTAPEPAARAKVSDTGQEHGRIGADGEPAVRVEPHLGDPASWPMRAVD